MPSLADGQNRFMACLQKGPGHFPADPGEIAIGAEEAHNNQSEKQRQYENEGEGPEQETTAGTG